MKSSKCTQAFSLIALAGLIACGPALAQEPPDNHIHLQGLQEKTIHQQVEIKDGKVILISHTDGQDHASMEKFLVSELSQSGKAVKGRPYSADASTEFSQTLSDGNRIYRKTTARLYRDSAGRTRREEIRDTSATASSGGGTTSMILISDPDTGTTYTMNPASQSAQKSARAVYQITTTARAADVSKTEESRYKVLSTPTEFHIRSDAPGGAIMVAEPYMEGAKQPKTESLGVQVIEGIQAEGTRTTVTLPAGTIGNYRPIEIISEKWYSPDLDLVVMTKQIDPRVGETTYRLTNLNRREPDPALFEVPGGYKVMEGGTIIKHK